MPGNHSLISPSSAERVLNCPVSVARSLLFPFERTNPAAEEGTKAHAVLEAVAKDDYLPDFATDDMIRYAVRFIELLAEAGYGDRWQSEVHVDPAAHPALAGLHPEPIMSGTADMLIPDGAVDYKYGRKRVPPDALQVLLYGASQYPQKIYVTGIYQPNVNPDEIAWAHTTEETMTEKLTQFADSVREAIRFIVLQQTGVPFALDEYKEGSHCYFCPSLSYCPKKFEGLTSALDNRSILPIEKLLEMLEDFESYANSVRETAFNMVLSGSMEIPGWGAAPGRRPPGKWADKLQVMRWIETQRMLGSIPDTELDALVTIAPASPAQVKKLLKEIPEDLAEMIIQEEPKLTLQRRK